MEFFCVSNQRKKKNCLFQGKECEKRLCRFTPKRIAKLHDILIYHNMNCYAQARVTNR